LNERISKELKAEPYKPLDGAGLVLFFGHFLEKWSGLPLREQATTLLSGLAFGQFMPNANHRSAISIASFWLGINGCDITQDGNFEKSAVLYLQRSKEDIERAYGRAAELHGKVRSSYLWERYWPGHLRSTEAFLEGLPIIKSAIQSGKWGKTPQRRLEILLTVSSIEV
jgi:hypothetical protein